MGKTRATSPRRGRIATLASLIGGLVTLRVRRYEIRQASMLPTLADGDWMLALVRPRTLRPGDVVVFDHPQQPGLELVKRIASIDPSGITVLGDDPTPHGVDSVTFGQVPTNGITARVLLRYRPLPPTLIT